MRVFCGLEVVKRLFHTLANSSKHLEPIGEHHTQAVEEEDDDGQYAQTKEQYVEDLKELEQDGAFRILAYHTFPFCTSGIDCTCMNVRARTHTHTQMPMHWKKYCLTKSYPEPQIPATARFHTTFLMW